MAVEHRPGRVPGKPWYSTETDQYHESREAAEHYDRLQRMRNTPPDSVLDRMKTPDLRIHIEGRMASEAFTEAKQASGPAMNTFVKLNRWYVDCDRNSALMFDEFKAEMKARTLIPPFEYDDVMRIALKLKAAGVLVINQQAVQAEEQAKVEQEIANRKEYTEAELERMPTDQLERLVRGLPVES